MKRLKQRWPIYWVRFWLSVILASAWAMVAHAEGAAPAATLSMQGAIQHAIETHLTIRLARASTQEARGRTIQAAASLLPRITGQVSQSRIFKSNLATQGFQASSFLPNPLIGPYNNFDARVELVQNLLDVNAIWLTKEASAQTRAATLQESLAAEQVASAAALAYIEGVRAVRAVQDAQANLELAQGLARLAHQQHDAGAATGVDVARAETHVAEDQQNLIQARLAATEADIRLKRIVGIPLETAVTLADPLRHPPQPSSSSPAVSGRGSILDSPPTTAGNDRLVTQAQSDRVELLIAREQVKAESYGLAAARSNFLPTVDARGDYGYSGNEPQGSERTGSIGARLSLPIFSGGATTGEVKASKARHAAAQNQLDDIHIQVEEDVRLALHTVSAEAEGVTTADTQVTLAERELKLAQDRYAAGAGDNIQVVSAQTALAGARQSRVVAQARHADARANLAMALGHMRTFQL